MIKKAYKQPAMKIVKIQQAQMLCGSLTSVKSTGLDEEEELVLLEEGQPKSGNVWDNAW